MKKAKKVIIVLAAFSLLAGCGHMGMRTSGSGDAGSAGMSEYEKNTTEKDRIFNSWIS